MVQLKKVHHTESYFWIVTLYHLIQVRPWPFMPVTETDQVNFMLKLKTREGFSIARASEIVTRSPLKCFEERCVIKYRIKHLKYVQMGAAADKAEVKQFKQVFDRFDDNNNGEAWVTDLN